MQELIKQVEEWMIDDKYVEDNPLDYDEYIVHYANQMIKVKSEFIDMCKSMLEKEKEVICEFADDYQRNCFQKSAYQYYNETFNTNEI